MISRYRNRGLLQVAGAVAIIAVSGIIYYLFHQRDAEVISDNWDVLFLLAYLSAVALVLAATFSFAKAKGYSEDMVGGILIFLILFGLCVPCAAFVFPVAVVFGLKDRNQTRSYRR